MDVGFTGTQRGMTEAQAMKLREMLLVLGPGEFHHGDCIGADSQAHDIADACGYRIILHPPTNPSKRAWRQVPQHMMRGEFPYLMRNQHIVNETRYLFATPGEFEEQLRSGTWSTIRYARRIGRRPSIILPDGSLRS